MHLEVRAGTGIPEIWVLVLVLTHNFGQVTYSLLALSCPICKMGLVTLRLLTGVKSSAILG